jgi:CheY-like chemotaxis protein
VKIRVLLIDDDVDVTETINSILENFYEVEKVDRIVDGSSFRKGLWRTGNYDAIILDLMLPGITGFEMCEQLKSYPTTRAIPILALTGYDTLQNEQRIKKAGADAYLAKPFDVSKFRDELSKLINRREGKTHV